MVTIRLARAGCKKHPFYRIVVADSRSPRNGRYIELLGYYNPMPAGKDIPLKIADEKRVAYWISQGAQPSTQVKNLIKQAMKTSPVAKNAEQGQAVA